MNNTPGPSPQHPSASAPAPSPATVASRHAARSTAPKPGMEQRRTKPRRAVRVSGEPDAPKPKPKPKPHPPAQQQPQQADSPNEEADFPYVALTIQTTGIHPSTGRIVTIDAITFNDASEQGQQFHAVLKPDIDAGPRHLHGLSTTDIEQAPAFGKILKSLDKLIDGRTLIVHDLPYTWGLSLIHI